MELERGIPIPPRGNAPGKPWDDMQPGMSFFVATQLVVDPRPAVKPVRDMSPDEVKKLRAKLAAKAHSLWGPRSYSIRAVEKDGVPGLRLWRLK